MSFPNESQNDPLDAVLVRKKESSCDDNFRQAVIGSTLGVIRWRRRTKRCLVAGTLLGCYLAGMATVAFWQSGTGVSANKPSNQIVTVTWPSADPSKQLPPKQTVASDKKTASKPASKFETIRREGDQYLRDPAKLQLAIRTYSRALKYASAEEKAISPEQDTWLLMALKDAHSKKETKHENSQI